jgi:hypothetical protein
MFRGVSDQEIVRHKKFHWKRRNVLRWAGRAARVEQAAEGFAMEPLINSEHLRFSTENEVISLAIQNSL